MSSGVRDYEELAALADEHLARDDFDPFLFCTERLISPNGLTQIALEATAGAVMPDTPEGRAAMFIQGFQLGVLLAESG